MTPYYDDGWVRIYHGDSLELLPHIEASVLLTDPVWPNATVPLAGADDPEGLFREAVDALPACVTRAAVQIGCDTDPAFLTPAAVRWQFFRTCWLEVVRPHYKGRLMYGADVAYLYGTPPPSRPGARVIPGRYIDTSSNGRPPGHPCPRKIAHVAWLVRWWSAEEDVVVDPFLGIGTTALACKSGGRRCIGIEIEERYCEIAANRLQQEVFDFAAHPSQERGTR